MTVRFTMAGIAFLLADLAVFIGRLSVKLFEEPLFYELKKSLNSEREAV